MLIRRRRHATPGLNTTSTADISFMLLIFFLVTTSMDTDKGITRQLPPNDDTEDNTVADVSRDKIMQLRIMADNSLTVNGKAQRYDMLHDDIVRFVERVGQQHLITVEADGHADYDSYFALQGQIAEAFRLIRDKEAVRRYRKPMAQCSPSQRRSVMEACPQHVAEDYDTARHTTQSRKEASR